MHVQNCLATATALALSCAASPDEHTSDIQAEKRQSGNGSIPLLVSNWCQETIWPAIITQSGTGPDNTGWAAKPNSNQSLYVSQDWQGRVWARSNCSFDSSGSSAGSTCSTGDCGGLLACQGPGANPATLAEFALQEYENSSFYDISLVDGYNYPMAIVVLPNNQQNLEALDPATTNPSCVASAGDVAAQNFNPYTNNQQFLGTSSQSPLPFETKETPQNIASWCPWDLQVSPPLAPGNGVYPYPDGNVARPAFNPCLSACAKYNQPNYCCTGQYDGTGKCSPNYYSKASKSVCPDAYSYAYDDADSTFAVPEGGGFQVVFCPGGRSTTIIQTKGEKASQHGSSSSGSSALKMMQRGWLLSDGSAMLWRLCLVGVVAGVLL